MISGGSVKSRFSIIILATEPFSTVRSWSKSLLFTSLMSSLISMSLLRCYPPRPLVKWTKPSQWALHVSQRLSWISMMSTSLRSRVGASWSFLTWSTVFPPVRMLTFVPVPVPVIDPPKPDRPPVPVPDKPNFLRSAAFASAIAMFNYSLAIGVQIRQKQ